MFCKTAVFSAAKRRPIFPAGLWRVKCVGQSPACSGWEGLSWILHHCRPGREASGETQPADTLSWTFSFVIVSQVISVVLVYYDNTRKLLYLGFVWLTSFRPKRNEGIIFTGLFLGPQIWQKHVFRLEGGNWVRLWEGGFSSNLWGQRHLVVFSFLSPSL